MDAISLFSRQARAFIAVAEELHFGRAAQRLHISQPPLSQQVRQFEEQMGMPLLVRNTRSVQLTLAGAQLLASLRQILHDSEAALIRAGRAARGELGALTVGFTSSAAYKVLPDIVARYRDACPGIELSLVERESAELLDSLLAERIDIALMRRHDALDDPRLLFDVAEREPLVAALPARHRLARRPSIALQDLHGQDLVGFSASGSRYFHELLAKLFAQAGVRPHVVHQSVLPTILALVEANVGLALVPASVTGLRGSAVRYRPLAGGGQAAMSTLFAVRRHDGRNPAVAGFMNLLLPRRAAASRRRHTP
ncbi:LysR substrate-binding domain-containing protein [Bordetella petrii]|uniref:LysR substrate-binding domain-containing protein n=1 Tax=Bordetella petrii TaxID=94624 RepID=UPI001A95FE39|nr:LysR substrate-binding domain-containing protein [Bordetella petrii]MBO1114484.1 LysR family transcriptional regulator [Bordetella petrii]